MDITTILTILAGMTPEQIMLSILFIIVVFILFKGFSINKKVKKQDIVTYTRSELSALVQSFVNATMQINDINNEILPDQLYEVDNAIMSIKTLLINNYRKLGPTNKDIINYENIIYKTLNETQKCLKVILKENGLLDKTETEYEVFIEDKKALLLGKHAGLLDREYISDFFEISRDELREFNELHIMRDISDIIRKLFLKVREITREKKDKIKCIRDSAGLVEEFDTE